MHSYIFQQIMGGAVQQGNMAAIISIGIGSRLEV